MTELDFAYKPGDIVNATYTFRKHKNEDLSFHRNEALRILNISKDSNWAHAKNSVGETGLIPLNYVQLSHCGHGLHTERWYHGRISRAESEYLLSGYPPGSFLVRHSDLFTGDLTLCVVGPSTEYPDISTLHCVNGTNADRSPLTNVQHYHIVCKPHNPDSTLPAESAVTYSLDEVDWFTSLPDLIRYYSVPDSGLVSSLKHPVPDMQRQRLRQLRDRGWIITRKDLVLGDQIGRGEFGVSSTSICQQTLHPIAYPIHISLALFLPSFHSNLNHPNLVSFVGIVYEPEVEAIYLVTEYLAQGNLLTFLHSRTRDEVTETDKLQFSIDVCRGLTYLEDRCIVHRDIAARNILLSGQSPHLTAKVADFGMARDLCHSSPSPPPFRPPTSAPPSWPHQPDLLRLDDHPHGSSPPTSEADLSGGGLRHIGLHDSAAIPIKWTAPEAVRERLFTNKSDVWSFGVLLWEIYSFGRIPYPRMMANQALRQIVAGYRMKAPEGCPTQIYRLMRRTWHINPDERPCFSSILEELQSLSKQYANDPPFSPTWRAQDRAVDIPAFTLSLPNENPWNSKQTKRSSLLDPKRTLQSSESYENVDNNHGSTIPRGQRHHPSPTSLSSVMSRSFTMTGSDGDVQNQASPSLTTSSEASRPNAFCLPKFERVRH
ncbi:unnamed protein product [Dicrocoelium dendriticum]|nr:unnamed protein product [Dicrocoelium dendriticum]